MLDIFCYFIISAMITLIVMMGFFKDFYKNMICVGLLGNLAALLIVTLGCYPYNESFIDIAIIYMLLSYIVNMAITKISVIKMS